MKTTIIIKKFLAKKFSLIIPYNFIEPVYVYSNIRYMDHSVINEYGETIAFIEGYERADKFIKCFPNKKLKLKGLK